MSIFVKNHKRSFFLVFTILFSLPALCLLTAFVIWQLISASPGCTSVHKNRYFTLPMSVTDLDTASYEDSVSCTQWVRFRIPPSELEPFVTTTLIESPLSATIAPNIRMMMNELVSEADWTVNVFTSSLSGEGDITDQSQSPAGQRIFVDTSDENQYVVYLWTRGYWDWWMD
jgi:hypothetical protein